MLRIIKLAGSRFRLPICSAGIGFRCVSALCNDFPVHLLLLIIVPLDDQHHDMPILEAIAVAAGKAELSKVDLEGKLAEIHGKDITEIIGNKLEAYEKTANAVMEKLNDIRSMSPEQLRHQMEANLSQYVSEAQSSSVEKAEASEGLSAEEKQRIKVETGWSDKIVDAIGSWEEFEIYKNAGLVEAEIGGKKCLIRGDIDWEQKDAFGRSNRERIQKNLSPLNKSGEPIELHHIGQHADSPFAELTLTEHRGKGNDLILHNKNINSEINRNAFCMVKRQYWQERAKDGGI